MSVLADHVDVIMGQAPSGDQYNDRGEGWPLIAGAGDFAGSLPRPKKYTITASKLSQPNDIVIGIRASIGSKVWSDGEYCLGRGVAALRPRESVDGAYLWHWFEANRTLLESKARGATFLQVNRADIAGLPFEPPPLPEQRRIASMLDQADRVVSSRSRQLASLAELEEALYRNLFTNSEMASTSITQLRSLVTNLSSGKSIVGSEDDAGDFQVLKISAVTSGEFRADQAKPLPSGYVPPDSHLVHEGDVLMSRANTAALVGASAMVMESVRNVALPDKLWRLEWRSEYRPFAVFFWQQLRSAAVRTVLSRKAGGSGGSMKNLSQSDVLDLELVVPADEVMHRFQREWLAVNSLRSTSLSHLRQAEKLAISLRARAFRGEL